MKLNERQRKFADEYLMDYCAAKAARRAGYSAGYGKELLRNDAVRAYLEEKQQRELERAGVTAERVLEELSAVAFSNIADFTEVKKDAESKRGVAVKARETESIPRNKLSAVAGFKEGPGGIEVKLYEKLRALELLGKYVGLFRETDKAGGPPVVIIDDVPEKVGCVSAQGAERGECDADAPERPKKEAAANGGEEH